LSALLDQSLDCIKLISTDGVVQYMNRNGQCAMGIENFAAVQGSPWTEFWPDKVKPQVLHALEEVKGGNAVRFDAFCPTATGASRWWGVSVSPVRTGDVLLGYLAVARDVTEARLAIEIAEIAAAELMHRLGNSYAMVGSLLSSFARGTPQLEVFAAEMRERLSALAIAQSASIGRPHEDGSLADLLTDLLGAFSTPACPITIDVPADLRIDHACAHAMALVFGELAVNASKHGGLSAAGQITVTAKSEGPALLLHWHERSDRPVAGHGREDGQGLRILRRIMSSSGGDLAIVWAPFGLDADIRFPAH
jgi:PAS domain S-box-containing protein